VLALPRKHYIGGHLGRLGSRDEVPLHQQYVADIAESSRQVIDSFHPPTSSLRARRSM
jgi:hypothetical protein